MIEGYSVDEAASVLGVPKGRVWELLARGILAGTPEDGGGMRVYLQGRPMEPIVGRAPEGRPGEPGERHGPNGNGGEHGQPGFEASPFRELLTEFRNLTERYGQALLALGESRGEVASLRTRVELLEARVDLRLTSAPPLVQWSPPPAPAQAAPQAELEPEPTPSPRDEPDMGPASTNQAPEPAASAVAMEPVPAEEQATKATRRRRRRPNARSATEGFAEALARAQDPTSSELPGGEEAQAALNELREQIRHESLGDEDVEEAQSTIEPADTMGFSEVMAPAPEVELDDFLADEELGGAVGQASAADAAQADLAGGIDQRDQIGEEPIQAVQQVPDTEPVQAAELVEAADAIELPEPIEAVEAVEPIGGAEPEDTVEPIEPESAVSVEAEAIAETASIAQPDAIAEATPDVPVYSHEWDEPDWIAEEDVDWGSGESATSPDPVAMGESPEIGWDELPAATAQADHEPAPETASEPAPEPAVAEDHPEEREASDPPTSPSIAGKAWDDEVDAPPTAPPSTSQPIQVDAVESPAIPASPQSAPVEVHADIPQSERPPTAQAAEEELMWLGDEFRAGPSRWGPVGRATTIPKPARSQAVPEVVVSPAEDEALARLAVERGWDDDELRAIRSLLAQPSLPALDEADPGVSVSDPLEHDRVTDAATESAQDLGERTTSQVDAGTREEEAFDWEQGPSAWSPPPMSRAMPELPGAVELDEAMAAFEIGAWSKESAQHSDEATPSPVTGEPGNQVQDQSQARQPPASPQFASDTIRHERDVEQPPEPPSQAASPALGTPPSDIPPEPSSEDADWLRGRRGPAANAYRRLRRLFP